MPVVHEITPCPSLEDVIVQLADCENLIVFDSAKKHAQLGRYSFVAANPVELFKVDQPQFGTDPFADIRRVMEQYRVETIDGLPPFQGGAAGVLGYELGHSWERLPTSPIDEFELPAMVVGLYHWVLAWDHIAEKCWFVGHDLAGHLASDAYEWVTVLLRQPATLKDARHSNSERFPRPALATKASPMDGTVSNGTLSNGIVSNFSATEYLAAVQRVIDYIYAGDIFQTNLSQRLVAAATQSPLAQYLELRRHNPAPFAGYFAHADWAVMSSSPERFVQVRGRNVSTRPIKGTRQRQRGPEADLYSRDELRESAKDHAENVMIVDLLRNDLSRVCEPGSIRVPELCVVEMYETVTHLVSEVCGQLRPEATFWDLLSATFPGGSITGAPKIRAMEIITELEQVARGFYCGSLFYHSVDGTADSNILIRTITHRNGWLQFPVGGGVVAQSTPIDEYEETLTKATGIVRSLKQVGAVHT